MRTGIGNIPSHQLHGFWTTALLLFHLKWWRLRKTPPKKHPNASKAWRHFLRTNAVHLPFPILLADPKATTLTINSTEPRVELTPAMDTFHGILVGVHRNPSWWLNQPLWKICESQNWTSSPNRGEHKHLWNHQLGILISWFMKLIPL